MNRLALSIAILLGTPIGCGSSSEAPPVAATTAPSAPLASGKADAQTSENSARPAPVREGSVIVRSPEGDAVFIADEDHELVRSVELPAEVRPNHVETKVPGRPAQVLATRDRVLVTIRQIDDGEGALIVFRRKPGGLDLEETGRVTLSADAWGIAITPDENTAIISSAWTHTLSAVDLTNLKVLWTVSVAREPRGITILPSGDRAYVSHLVGSNVTRVDGLTSKQPSVKTIELPAAPLRSPPNTKLPASLGYSVIASPSGDRVYFPRHALGALGQVAWFGVASVDILMTEDDSPLAPARSPLPTAHFAGFVAKAMKGSPWFDGNGAVMQGSNILEPRAVVYRKRTNTLLVANEGSDEVTELDALAMDPTLVHGRHYQTGSKYDPVLHVPQHGGVPSGIALSEKEDKGYVFCRGTDDLVVLDLDPDAGSYYTVPPIGVSLGPNDDDKQLTIGKGLFYKADNDIISGGLACASCHPEGRDDGHVWHEATVTTSLGTFTNFFAGSDLSDFRDHWGDITVAGEGGLGYARQTPMLAGRLKASGPYGWHAESVDLQARIIAGFSLHRWQSGDANKTMPVAFAGYLSAFVRQGLVPPPKITRPLTDDEAAGKRIFESAATKCASCHVPQSDFTDHTVADLKKLKPPSGFAEDPSGLYKTPSLLFVGGTPPYLHDGRFDSLESLIEYNQDRMGKTAQLSPDERKSLIAYLRTL